MFHYFRQPYYLIINLMPTIINNVFPSINQHNQPHTNYKDSKCIITERKWLYMKYFIPGIFNQVHFQHKLPQKKPNFPISQSS